MEPIELKTLINEHFGEINQLYMQGKLLEANALLDKLVMEIVEGFDGSKSS